MRLLADENIESALSDWLASIGHDVKRIAESSPSVDDDRVLAVSVAEDRILITYDHDFGELIFRQRSVSAGIVLLRFPPGKLADRLKLLQIHWPEIESWCPRNFIVVSDERIRVRRQKPPNRVGEMFPEDGA